MFERAEARGDLRPGMQRARVLDRQRGHRLRVGRRGQGLPCTIVMPEGMSDERKKIMRAYGAELVFTPGGESDVDLSLRPPARRSATPRRGATGCRGSSTTRTTSRPTSSPPAPSSGSRRAVASAPSWTRRARAACSPASAATSARRDPRCGSTPSSPPSARCSRAARVGPPRHRGHRRRLRAPQPRRLAPHRRHHHHHRGERGRSPGALAARRASSAASRAAATWPPRSSSRAGTPSCRPS